MIVTIVAIVKIGCDDPDDHMKTLIFFLGHDCDDQERLDRRDRNLFYLSDCGNQMTIKQR